MPTFTKPARSKLLKDNPSKPSKSSATPPASQARQAISQRIIILSSVASLVIFGLVTYQSAYRTLVPSDNFVSPDHVTTTSGSFGDSAGGEWAAGESNAFSADIRADDAAWRRRFRERNEKKVDRSVRLTAYESHQRSRRKIEDHLRQVRTDEADAVVPKDYLKFLDKRFADAPGSF